MVLQKCFSFQHEALLIGHDISVRLISHAWPGVGEGLLGRGPAAMRLRRPTGGAWHDLWRQQDGVCGAQCISTCSFAPPPLPPTIMRSQEQLQVNS